MEKLIILLNTSKIGNGLFLLIMVGYIHLKLKKKNEKENPNALDFVMWRLIWFNNLWQYILRYTVRNFWSHKLRHISLDDVRLARLQFETKLQKCIRMRITIFKIYIWGGILSVLKSHFTAPLLCCRNTKFPTVYPTIYLPKLKFWIQLSPNFNHWSVEY